MTKLIKIEESPIANKKLRAIFSDGTKTDFGSKKSETYINHKDKKKRDNYIARHSQLNEDWNDPKTAGALSRYILWEKPNINDAVKNYKKKFSV